MNNDISYVNDNNLLNDEEFISDDKESYIDSINFAELLNLYNITTHELDKTEHLELKKNQKIPKW